VNEFSNIAVSAWLMAYHIMMHSHFIWPWLASLGSGTYITAEQ